MTKEDLEKLKKIGVKSPLELALIKPKEYEDNYLYPYILNSPQAFEAEIIDVKKSPKITRVKFYLKNVNQIIWGVFFQFRKWHQSIFKPGHTLYIRGEIKQHQIIQPKPISRINEITPVYKTSLNIRSLKMLIKRYVTLENLSLLPQNIAKTVFFMHFPQTKEHTDEQKIIYALKWAEIYNYILKLKSKKKSFPSVRIKADADEFIKNLPFKLTGDQLKVINEIKKDVSQNHQARRVIIGDVGSGKTVVMLAAAYMAEKSIIMCPTSILANQIYEEAEKFFKWKIEKNEWKNTLVTQKSKFSDEDIENSSLLIGTHALLYQKLPKVNAVMVDEQHRFGTNQRAMLEKLTSSGKTLPHYFQFSATPIPRTQALIMSSFVDVSLIKQLPFKKDIDTEIISKEDFRHLIAHIQNEINSQNQTAVVYPLVEESSNFSYQSIEEGKNFWLKHFDKVYITHGKDKNKEEILLKFKEDGNILITTTVIEVGISLPRLTTIVIVGAERLGLATLHQLRGRVGRYGQKGHCFLYTNNKNNSRLKAFANTLDGFKIAQLDLEYRKSGDLLDGKIQSGEKFKYFDELRDLKILEDVKHYINS